MKYLSTFFAGSRFAVNLYDMEVAKQVLITEIRRHAMAQKIPEKPFVLDAHQSAIETDYDYAGLITESIDDCRMRMIIDALNEVVMKSSDNLNRTSMMCGLIYGLKAGGMLTTEVFWHIARAIQTDELLMQNEELLLLALPFQRSDEYLVNYSIQKSLLLKDYK